MRTDRSRAARWAAYALMAVSLGCDGADMERLALGGAGGEPAAAPDGGDVVQAAARSDGAGAEPATGPRRLYYDLTVFEWYRHGEPLQLGERPYLPQGNPRAIPAERMHRVGVYRGVDVYVLDGLRPPYGAVFVPVFRRYWQPFVLQHRTPVHAD